MTPDTTPPLPVALTVVGADRLPTERDRALTVAAQALLMQDAHFQLLRTPTLSRCEIDAGLDETSQGYLYLRYDVAGAVPQEFWAHWGTHGTVAWKSGQVTVKQGNAETPKPG